MSTDVREPDLLGLSGVLAHALPLEVGTDSSPSRYTVPAVFTRRPLAHEIERIEGRAAHDELVVAGYPSATLKVVDRRLEIGGTSLEELGAGLARVIATMLRNASIAVSTEDAERREQLRLAGERELARSSSLVERAARISFVPEPI